MTLKDEAGDNYNRPDCREERAQKQECLCDTSCASFDAVDNNKTSCWAQFMDTTWPMTSSRRSSIDQDESCRSTVLLKINTFNGTTLPLEVQDAALIEANQCMFYERPINDVILLDEAKNLLFCLRPPSGGEEEDEHKKKKAKKKIGHGGKQQQQNVVEDVGLLIENVDTNNTPEGNCLQDEVSLAHNRSTRIAQNGPDNNVLSAPAEKRLMMPSNRNCIHSACRKLSLPEISIRPDETKPHLSDCKANKDPKCASNEMDIEEKILQRREMAHLFQWYYPEGGWGLVVLLCAMLSQALALGLQFGFSYPLGVAIRMRFYLPANIEEDHPEPEEDVEPKTRLIEMQHLGCLSGLCFCLSYILSPVIIAFCRKKSTRLTAVIGGLVIALGVLFTSFANQFHQLFFSYGTVIAFGVGMVRDSSMVMLGQYFKKKRELVEMLLACSTGIGILSVTIGIVNFLRTFGWRYGLHVAAAVFFVPFFTGTFYRSATLYHPQRRAILHLKSQQRKLKDRGLASDGKGVREIRAFKNRSLHFAVASAVFAAAGIYSPIVYLTLQAFYSGQESSHLLEIQIHVGIAWIVGCLAYGLIIISRPNGCRVTKLYLCICSLVVCGILCFMLSLTSGHHGYLAFGWLYGFFCSGYHYSFKMYLYELSRARNFALIWSLVQFGQGVGCGLGIPLAAYLGHASSGAFLLVSSLVLFSGDVYRKHLRAKKRHEEHLKQFHNTGEENQDHSHLVVHHNPYDDYADDYYDDEDEEEENNTTLPDSILELYRRRHSSASAMKEWHQIEKELFGDEAGAQPLQQQPLLQPHQNDILEEDITSCDKVENDMLASEFVQNLSRQHLLQPPTQQRLRGQSGRGLMWRKPSEDFNFITTSSSTSSSSGHKGESSTVSSSGSGHNGPPYVMSAALSAAMVTAAIPVARPVPAAPGQRPSKAIPEIPAFRNTAAAKAGWKQQRSITVIEEVSA